MEPATLSVSELNENFGISQWNGYHQCFHCCYCDLECPITQREMTFFQRQDAFRSKLLHEWQIELQKRAKENFKLLIGQLGQHLDYRQVIHKECLSLMKPDERLTIQELNPNNRPIPGPDSNALVDIRDYRLLPHTAFCLRCDAVLEITNQGYAFESWQQKYGPKKTSYIHKKCLAIMRQFQDMKK